jgi:hypothetical protein
MVTFLQYVVVFIVTVIIYVTYFDTNESKRRGFKWNLATIISFLIIISPVYFEYPDWGSSVPVTFSHDDVVEHPFGAITSPFGLANDFTNMPTREYSTRLFMNSRVTEDGKRIMGLVYNFSIYISSPKKFYAKADRRILASYQSENELGHILDSVSLAFAASHPNTSTTRLIYPDHQETKRMRDSLRNVFDGWLTTYRPDDEGMKIVFDGVETRGTF